MYVYILNIFYMCVCSSEERNSYRLIPCKICILKLNQLRATVPPEVTGFTESECESESKPTNVDHQHHY